jgi:hypothetical protein
MLVGGFEPELNGFLTPTVSIAPQGTFELDSFRLCAAVNQAKILLQHQGLAPPLNPVSIKKLTNKQFL